MTTLFFVAFGFVSGSRELLVYWVVKRFEENVLKVVLVQKIVGGGEEARLTSGRF